MKSNLLIFVTKRLAVRRYNWDDEETLYEYPRQTSNKELPNEILDTIEHAKTYVEMAIHSCRMGHFPIRYAIVLKENNKMIGALSYKATPERGVQLTLMIAEEYQNHGYASEITPAAIDYAKRMEGIDNIYAFVRLGNKPAISVAEKSGFIQIDEFEADWFCNREVFRKYKI